MLDSTHPDQVAAVAESIDPARTIFIVSSKSGGTLETISGFRFFWAATGGNGRRFIAITDPGSSLEQLGRDRGFRAVVTAPSGCRWTLLGADPFRAASGRADRSGPGGLLEAAAGVSWESEVELGISWAAGRRRGATSSRSSPPRAWRPSPDGSNNWWPRASARTAKGIVPVAGEPPLDRYGDDRVFVLYTLAGRPVAGLPPPGHPLVERSLGGQASAGRPR